MSAASRGNFVGGRWVPGDGTELASTNPATGAANWSGRASESQSVRDAISAAETAFPLWSSAPLDARLALVKRIESAFRDRKPAIAAAISAETGKPRWEAATEVDAMIAKIPISVEAFSSRCAERTRDLPGAVGRTRYRPHGLLVVLGPFNMPGHLPNGHVIPALIAGNAVVYKPSEQAPLVGQAYAEAIETCGLPPGVFNVVHGARRTGELLVADPRVHGVLFTGSSSGGASIERLVAGTPGKLLALEMGGNNPLVFLDAPDLRLAAAVAIQSAFITAGQRCSCARRLVVVDGPHADAFVATLIGMTRAARVGLPSDDPEPFVGTLISADAAGALLQAQSNLLSSGASPLLAMARSDRSPALLTPGILDVTPLADRPDVEHFGPLLQLVRVPTFEAALAEANRTEHGLSAGLISSSRDAYDRFANIVRAGVLSWNRPTTGASSQLPFGGIGRSGNHRPSGYFAADYASYAVAAVEAPLLPAGALPPGLVP